MDKSFLPWFLLIVSIFVLVAVPFINKYIQRFGKRVKNLDKILNWGFAGILVFHMLPEVISVAGYSAIALAVAGFLLALGLDSLGSKVNAWRYIPAVVLIGLSLHGFLDGFAIQLSKGQMVHGLGEVVVFHRLFAGIFIWQVCIENYSKRVAGIILALLGVATVIGFVTGPVLLKEYSVYANASFVQAFVLGGILHIAFHRDVSSSKK